MDIQNQDWLGWAAAVAGVVAVVLRRLAAERRKPPPPDVEPQDGGPRPTDPK